MIVSAFAGGPAFLHLVLVQERASAALLLPFARAQRARRRWAAPDVDAVQELRRGAHVRPVGLAGSSFSYSFAEQSNFSHSAVPSSDGSEVEELGDSEITTRVHERDASQTDRRT